MSTTSKAAKLRYRYHSQAYDFVFAALRFTQQRLERGEAEEEEDLHITGRELLDGARLLAIQQFGLMALAVFHHWGVHSTDDIGRIVFELIERGEMRKTDRDQVSDFFDVYDFAEVFDRDYEIPLDSAFKR